MTGTLHLAASNLNHRTGKKAIPPAVIHAIAALEIDVLVLTEFVDGDHQVRFKDIRLENLTVLRIEVLLDTLRRHGLLIFAHRTESLARVQHRHSPTERRHQEDARFARLLGPLATNRNRSRREDPEPLSSLFRVTASKQNPARFMHNSRQLPLA